MPFTTVSLGKTTFQITTSVGRCLHTYDLRKGLNLVFLTRPQTPLQITATCAWKDRVIAAWGGQSADAQSGIWVFKRGQKVGELELPMGGPDAIQRLLVFGSWMVGCGSKRIEVWKSNTYEHYTTITPRTSGTVSGAPLTGALCNAPTFLNKIFVGKRDGCVDIWNISTGKLIYTIRAPSTSSGPVMALEPSPAVSVLAISRADGTIFLQNIRTDTVLLSLNTKLSQPSTITSISFRTDGLGAGDDARMPGIMATAGPDSSDIVFWDLNQGGRVKGTLRGAHHSSILGANSGGINRAEFLPGQDVMMTSGPDNALKSWIFDANSLSATPRILHSRAGHAAPVTTLQFLPSNADGSDAEGKWLMSAGRDQSLWAWSLRRDGQSSELSQGSVQRKAKKLSVLGKKHEASQTTSMEDLRAPEITSMACSLNRDGGVGAAAGVNTVWTNTSSKKGPADAAETNATGWESVVTAHRGDNYARTWFWGRKKAGRWAFESGDGTEVSTVAITGCGTFALVGSAGGSITTFNLQSGIQRQKFPSPISPAQARKLKMGLANGDNGLTNGDNLGPGKRAHRFAPGQGKHTRAVTGIMVDSLNRTVFSCSLDGKIKFWDFATGLLQDEIDWYPMSSILASRYHRHNDLIALSCDDLAIRIVDTETKKLVREFWGCLGQICDFCFSNDGRWIIAASMDSVIRVWDLPTGHLINAFGVESPCTALAFSPTGEYLATAHTDSVGVNIWNNRTLFTHVPTRLLREDEITDLAAPTSSGEGGQNIIDAALNPDSEESETEDADFSTPTTVDQLSSDLISLSLVPKSRWQNLLHLDSIRQRNKPMEPPKAPEKAPFFLPSLGDSTKPSSQPITTSQRSMANGDAMDITPSERTRISKSSTIRNEFSSLLNESSVSGNYEPFVTHFSTLAPSAADIEIRSLKPEEMPQYVDALTFRLEQKKDFDLVQTWMAVFLRVWGDVIVAAHQDDENVEEGEEKKKLREALGKWREVQEAEKKRLTELVGFCSGVIGFLRSER